MHRNDKIKLLFLRNWNLPGRERLIRFLKPSANFNETFKDGLTWLSHEHIGIYASTDNYIENTILSTGTYEAEIGRLIAISLKEGNTALDIGANIGLQSLRMAHSVGKTGIVLSFEPLEYLQKKFLNNVALNRVSNIKLLPLALADLEEERTFYINETTWNQGTFSLSSKETAGTTQNVEMKRGDDLQEITTLKSLELIKVDVEGFEFNVLKGLKATIEKFKPRIIFEYDPHYWTRNGQSIDECYSFLTGFDYDIYQIYPVGCERIFRSADLKGGNLICIPHN